MFTMILLLYLQQNLDVTLDQARLRGEYRTMAQCEAQARKLRGPLPIPRNMQAAWQDALCIRINNNVHVNTMKPVELGELLQQHPPLGCQAEGAWAVVARMCGPPVGDAQEAQTTTSQPPQPARQAQSGEPVDPKAPARR